MMYQYFIAEWFCHRSLNFSELHSPHLWKGDGSKDDCEVWWWHEMVSQNLAKSRWSREAYGHGVLCSIHLFSAFASTVGGDFVTVLLLLNAHWCHLVWAPWWTFFALVKSVKASWPLVTTVRTPQAYVYAWRNWLCWGSLSCDRGRRSCSSSRPNKVASSLVVLVLNRGQILSCWLDSKQVIMFNTSMRRKQKWEQLFLIPQH